MHNLKKKTRKEKTWDAIARNVLITEFYIRHTKFTAFYFYFVSPLPPDVIHKQLPL